MFERYLTDALVSHFGHVIENLDSDKARLSAWNGQVVLNDLSLRRNALESFLPDCPVEIAYGKVGNLELRIPWRLFKSQMRWRGKKASLLETNCSIILKDVNILITPRREWMDRDESNEQKETLSEEDMQQNKRTEKEKRVQSLLDADLLRRVATSTRSSRWGWVRDWLSNLLSTLSITIENIHIRYEDPGTSMGYVWQSNADGAKLRRYRPAFAVGITLQVFSFQAADNEDTKKIEDTAGEEKTEKKDETDDSASVVEVKDTQPFQIRQKIAAGENLAIYWDGNCELISVHSSNRNIKSDATTYCGNSFRILNGEVDYFFEDSNLYNEDHTYVLDPISPTIDINLVSTRKSNVENELDPKVLPDESTTDTQEAPANTILLPASSFSIDLPPCKLTLSRITLEDTAYIRKSLSVWNQWKRGFLPEASLRRLAELRPATTPLGNAKKWWIYAGEATIELLKVQRAGKKSKDIDWVESRKRGWVGFMDAVRRRREYIKLSKEFLAFIKQNDKKISLKTHQALVEMEDGLNPREIVAFRIALYDEIEERQEETVVTVRREKQKEIDVLSVEHRSWMMDEMLRALNREKANMDRVQSSQNGPAIQTDEEESTDNVVWSASFVCRQFAIQVNDAAVKRVKNQWTAPIIQLSTAWILEHKWHDDGSWDTDCTLASLEVKDLTSSRNRQLQTLYPYLVGRKREAGNVPVENAIVIDGITYSRSVSVTVSRKLVWNTKDGVPQYDDDDRGSRTSFQIRILPMEIVYSTAPVEGLSRVLATIKTPELVDDMHRVASAAQGWRAKQKRKFLQTLAHEHKRIIVDVDVGSPELIIPEDINRADTPILAVDLGRLQISNELSTEEVKTEFDDKWQLALSDIQVRCTTGAIRNPKADEVENSQILHLVEPFSLNFTLLTRIASSDDPVVQETTKIQGSVTLPRLAFNLTSSAMRLVLRLKQQWEHRKKETAVRQSQPAQNSHRRSRSMQLTASPSRRRVSTISRDIPNGDAISQTLSYNSTICRVTRFDFSAPLITLRVSNDVDGRDCSVPGKSGTPLVDLAFRGITGKYIQEETFQGDLTNSFDAKLHSLSAIDLYQTAGRDFAMLLSSIPTQALPENIFDRSSWESYYAESRNASESSTSRRKDLVAIQYKSKVAFGNIEDKKAIEVEPNSLSIWFHELYIEWNAETFAGIQKALKLPQGQEPAKTSMHEETVSVVSGEEDEFFDAEEDEFFDAGSEVVTSIEPPPDLLMYRFKTSTWIETGGLRLSLPLAASSVSHGSPFLPSLASTNHEATGNVDYNSMLRTRSFEIKFELSVLSINFNKETRHRKLVNAQMDATSISYKTNSIGGSLTKMKMGNLVFTDPDSLSNKSLYGQILGLKSESENSEKSDVLSLLVMEILVNPPKREYNAKVVDSEQTRDEGVSIDRERGQVAGSNNFIRALFSPMRFVFLEQLWFEIIDYFFEGVMGTAVWGGKIITPKSLLKQIEERAMETPTEFLLGSDAVGFNFTRCDISLESPEIILPVSYLSPHHMRLELTSIKISNHYDGCSFCDDPTIANGTFEGERMQWFNNYNIALRGLRLRSWSGRELGKDPSVADITLRWPVGPLAYRIVPKWIVGCKFSSLDISLRRSEYALLQHIITFNIGEPSRHLDEWEVLQTISNSILEAYQERILVPYGYDKKDVPPTTYDVAVDVPLLSFSLIEEKEIVQTIAIVRCMDLLWSLRKESDRIVKQRLTCDIEVVTPSSKTGFDTLLSMSKYDTIISSEGSTSHETVPELTYTSTTQVSGNNVKTLEIVDPCIYVIVPAWSKFMEFFQELPEPEIWSAQEARSMLKVGDRWYRIAAPLEEMDGKETIESKLRWIGLISETIKLDHQNMDTSTIGLPKYQFHISLAWPRIILSSKATASNRLILRMNHLDYLNINDGHSKSIQRSFFLHDVEVYTVSSQKPIHRINEGSVSLIHPWSVVGLVEKCNGFKVGACESHTWHVTGDILKARAAYSDILVAIEVCMSVFNSPQDGKSKSRNKTNQKATTPQPTDSSTSSLLVQDDVKDALCNLPKKLVYNIALDGFELNVADDSGRHFAGTQDLIILSLVDLNFCREVSHDGAASVNLCLQSLDLFDCLQAERSPFRTAVSSREGVMGLGGSDPEPITEPIVTTAGSSRMGWEDYRAHGDRQNGFELSRSFVKKVRPSQEGNEKSTEERIEVQYLFSADGQHQYSVHLRSFALQWNPSTVIAIQRFLGRLRKDAVINGTQSETGEIESVTKPVLSSLREEQGIDVDRSRREEGAKTHASILIGSFTICLNKEHQHRRLVEVTLSSCQMSLDSSDEGTSVDGQLGDLVGWDSDNYAVSHKKNATITTENRNILKVLNGDQGKNENDEGFNRFLRFQYKTFRQRLPPSRMVTEVPSWVKPHLSDSGEIDDVLKVSLAALQFTYLRERTEEIIDYLSNGLPGKGMGVTSRAAKGFLEKRILTKSFLELDIGSPEVIIPQHETLNAGIMLKLGDVNLRSWFEQDFKKPLASGGQGDWWRILSLRLTGFCIGTMKRKRGVDDLSLITNPIDLEIMLRKPTVKGRELAVRGNLSSLDLELDYSDYVFLRAVARDNIGRNINTDAWDNVEKAYWLEEEKKEDDSSLISNVADNESRKVEYSSNARFVRYGKAGKRERELQSTSPSRPSGAKANGMGQDARTIFDLRFKLDGLSLKLRRDDDVKEAMEDTLKQSLHYDIMLLRVQLVEITLSSKDTGDSSFCLSLYRLGLFDLGDTGRLHRQRYLASLPSMAASRAKHKASRQPCAFRVLIEGYSLSEVDSNNTSNSEDNAQLVVNVDRCSAASAMEGGSLTDSGLPMDSKVTVAKAVVNNLSVNALIRPFKEIAAFMACDWETKAVQKLPKNMSRFETTIQNSTKDGSGSLSTGKNASGFQLKVVAHYPRVFFLADESDAHSRALVLRGLAVVDLSRTNLIANEEVPTGSSALPQEDRRHVTALKAQLYRMESYINPDVDEQLGFTYRHKTIVGNRYASIFPDPEGDESVKDSHSSDTLGVALIQPVTTGVEFFEYRRDLFPTKRSLFVNVEPVSTMFSFQDLQLIETVLHRWASRRSKKEAIQRLEHVYSDENMSPRNSETLHHSENEIFDIQFRTNRLGLSLKVHGDQVEVVEIKNSDLLAHVRPGDILIAIEGENYRSTSLDKVVRHLSQCKRPTTVTFSRRRLIGTPRKLDATPPMSKTKLERTPPTTPVSNEETTASVRYLDVRFRLGMSRGLELDKSICGRFPVVARILPNFFHATRGCNIEENTSDEIEATFLVRRELRIPRTGAVVVAINGLSVEEIGVKESFRRLEALSFEGSERNTYSSISDIMQSQVYWLSFMEADASVWGKVEEIDVSAEGIALSFIDDLQGRDMPLFRAKLSSVNAHIERGLGVEARVLDVSTPSLLKVPSDLLYKDDDNQVSLSEHEIANQHSEVVSAFSVLAMCSIDYFHPRVACWEPLMEPSQLFAHLEMQRGNVARRGQIALELSDYLLYERLFKVGLSSANRRPQMMAVNVTDAGAQVLVNATNQWKEWRKSIINESEGDDNESTSEVIDGDAPGLPLHHNVEGSEETKQPHVSDEVVTSRSYEQARTYRQTKRLKAQRAAQAALLFATKRGADNKESASAKPFVFKNRTGVSIAFAQMSNDKDQQKLFSASTSSVEGIGEYSGLEECSPSSVVVIADKEDARFSMEVIANQGLQGNVQEGKGTRYGSSKIRDYEGRFPNLVVSIQAVSGVSVDPLLNLQVYKVGSEVRHLVVKKDSDTDGDDVDDEAHYSIPVVWKVEIEDNRRILTLSTAVRVVSFGFNTPIEVGVLDHKEPDSAEDVSRVTSVGISRPEAAFFLPLWLALKLDPVDVYVRPCDNFSSNYNWSDSSVLHFGPSIAHSKEGGKLKAVEAGRWTWKQSFSELTYIGCKPVNKHRSQAFLTVFGTSSAVTSAKATIEKKRADIDEVISVTIDSGLTLRNMLPMNLEWEVAHADGKKRNVVDTSGNKETNVGRVFSFDDNLTTTKSTTFEPGQCLEVFASDVCSQELEARFKVTNGVDWSTWASLSLMDTVYNKRDKNEANLEEDDFLAAMTPGVRQVNVQVRDDSLEVPLTFGVRIVPKMTLPDDPQRGDVYGLEVIVFAELWIRNLTSLPLNFGCPAYQLHEPGSDVNTEICSADESLARFTAESALIEIANLLEVGDKGTGLRGGGAAAKSAELLGIESLPGQECDHLIEEVFEYIEIDSSTVKRRWWAAESYNSYRANLTLSDEKHENWRWLDDSWAIDCVGQAQARHGGWESCRALFTSGGSFDGTRTFDPAHTFRRRRYFRQRTGYGCSSATKQPQHSGVLRGGLQAIHQPLVDSFSKEQLKLKRKRANGESKPPKKKKGDEDDDDAAFKISVKSGDGRWCSPVAIPDNGATHGVIRLLSSRWPTLTMERVRPQDERSLKGEKIRGFSYKSASLEPDLFELCYSVADVDGEWGEFSRTMEISPRFLIKNTSEKFVIEAKQCGASDDTMLRLGPQESKPFFWADFRLPKLVSVRPSGYSLRGTDKYRWSGGFDICNIGMVPIRVRGRMVGSNEQSKEDRQSLRATVEVRPGTGGSGRNIALKEEDPEGDGSLFRIENTSTFPIWLAQDGNLVNPLSSASTENGAHGLGEELTQIDGDLIRPNEKFSFALDVPYRQGKYANRKEASISDLMSLRVALAPLSSRAGVETVKSIRLTTVGVSLRLNASKLVGSFLPGSREMLQQMRVLGIVTTDGPTRVLRFCLISHPAPDVFRNAFEEVSYMSMSQNRSKERIKDHRQQDFTREISDATTATVTILKSNELPTEEEARGKALAEAGASSKKSDKPRTTFRGLEDETYSIRADFGGFLFSLVDSVPSEIALASVKSITALARWNKLRTSDATMIASIGWIQVDNHVPSAPFKVALRPEKSGHSTDSMDNTSNAQSQSSPLLVLALSFAPKHKSGIMCLRSVTIAPGNIMVAIDLAFLVRIQRFAQGLQGHFQNADGWKSIRSGMVYAEQKKHIPFPKFDSSDEVLERAALFASENQNLYFQALTILPCNINFSVAPARALSPAQAALEGAETAAIHVAVRKGDVKVGNSSALLGVRVGRRNKTPLSVVRGVFKSIVVDALIRLDGASLDLAGVGLRNHISTGPQLTTYILAHYVNSLRHNVPALIGSLAAFGNPLGLIRGVGEGVSDFVSEPVKGFQKSVKELDPTFLVDGVARGTESLARHTVGGFADSASLLTDTFSKNMAVLTLDRRYAQKRDRDKILRVNGDGKVTLAGGMESGFNKLVGGFRDGVTGVVDAPIRGAEKRGIEGFAKGVGKGILGLMVKPIIGISDAATDVMIGVKSTVEKDSVYQNLALARNQLRPRRPMYGRDKVLRQFKMEDAAAATLMQRTSCAGEGYLSHIDMTNRVALFSVVRCLVLDSTGKELVSLQYEQIAEANARSFQEFGKDETWRVEILLTENLKPKGRRNGKLVEIVECNNKDEAIVLCSQIKQGVDLVTNEDRL
ncbi:unnamed protein product [Cylindrotheca closterium]|uniref:PDZ domain-containing protein n=1 Tax=Cylindrotheca closterium TaxID=2856 RepID=A0AAD2CWT0_9STRA|nr:unnamed protein product [Cylindrotheca closterium]